MVVYLDQSGPIGSFRPFFVPKVNLSDSIVYLTRPDHTVLGKIRSIFSTKKVYNFKLGHLGPNKLPPRVNQYVSMLNFEPLEKSHLSERSCEAFLDF